MKKLLLGTALFAGSFASHSLYASSMENVGLGINYGAFSGPTLELSYPISDSVQVRGALSTGMSLSEKGKETDIEYDVDSSGGIHRLALDYHPFNNGFFLSAGYAVNNFELDANGSGTNVTVGDTPFTADVAINSTIKWDNAPTLSLGWGHSPQKGLGFMIEAGAFFTGSPNSNMTGTCTGTCTGFDEALNKEEEKLQKDVADYDFLPMLQAGMTYRF
ncbi:MAG: hypothetical protein R3254_04820 [Thiomicrorhabdus sp.]|nr:hypothetical protein [Thiomicrorhabdus sp.]